MIINIIGGASASSRENSVTLEGFIGRALSIRNNVELWDSGIYIYASINPKCVSDTLEALSIERAENDEDTLLLIGKSLGAVHTWWLAYNHWDEIKHFKKIRIILIDPHGWQRGDGRWGSYGRKMLNGKWRDLERNTSWSLHSDFKIINLYQRDGGYPRGAILLNAWCLRSYWPVCVTQNIKLPPGANHWNCTDIKTDTGQFVAGIIRDVVEGLG